MALTTNITSEPKANDLAPHNPSPESRTHVGHLAAMGIGHHQISLTLSVAIETLRASYARDLIEAEVTANLQVNQTLHQLATSGRCPAASLLWAKTRSNFHAERPTSKSTTAPQSPPRPMRVVIANSKGEPVA